MNNKTKHTPVLSERDRSVFRDLHDSRAMTLAQISRLHFDGSYEYTKKRFQQLKAADYVHERKPKHNPGYYHASMLFLGRLGYAALAEDPDLGGEQMSWEDLRERLEIAETTLAHELEVVDMKVAFATAIRSRDSLVLKEFSTYPRLFQFETEHLERGSLFTLKPDGYARVSASTQGEQAFFFEWDRSNEAHRKLANKAFGYQRYIDSGAFAIWNGASAAERDNFPCTPVFILPNEERRNNTAEHLLRVRHPKTGASIHRDALLLTTHDEFLADPLGEIYLTLDAYKLATVATAYDPERHKATARARERDRLVVARITKTNLLGGV